MRLHALTMTAFGPFAARQDVDFDALSDGGLFLFHGPTGAGKTSILDAVCFALYGQVPGARQQAGALRSDHAAAGVGPQVTLELTVRGRRLLITRSPQWQRPKQRGAGTTTEQARVLVQELDGPSRQTLSTRLDESGQLLGRLIGLSMRQFCQVVLLPQGQFAEFLRADADRRGELLASLFDTGRFAAVEAWLVERRRDTARALGEHDELITRALERVAEAVDLPAVPAEVDGSESIPLTPPVAMLAWVGGLLAAAEAEAIRSQGRERELAQRREGARACLATAERLVAAQQRAGELAARQAQLEAAAPAALAVVTELESAPPPAPVAPLVAVTARLEQALAEAVGQAHSCSRVVSPALLPTVLAEPDGLLRHVGAVRAELSRLEHLEPDEREADQLRDTISALEREVVALDAQTDVLDRWFASAAGRRTGLDEQLRASRAADAALPGAAAELAGIERRLGAARHRDTLDAALPGLRDELRRLVDVAQTAKEQWLHLRDRRLSGMAAELAATLVDGCQCPVCGSPEHPAPAAMAVAAVTQAMEAAAQDAAETADRLRRAAEHAVLAAEAECSAAAAIAGADSSGADPSTESLVAERSIVRARHAELVVIAARLANAEVAVREFGAEENRRTEDRLKLASDCERLRGRSDVSRRRLSELGARLAGARGGDPTIRSRAARLTRLAGDCDALIAALTEADRLRSDLDAAIAEAQRVALAHGLPGLDGVRDLVRDDRRIDELDTLRTQRTSDAATLQELLGDPELITAAQSEAADLVTLRVELASAQAEHEAALGARDVARRRREALVRLDLRLRQLAEERAPLAEQHRLIDHLSRLAEGRSSDNRLRMSLSAYVLAARLEQVAAAASVRLSGMSSGRYTLVHSAQGSRGPRSRGPGSRAQERGGLHLRVLDAWTGSERDPATLSGGEGFAASLSLALGLADVVTAEAGGSLLETLFVDEGFGSLDEDTLDEVMGVLDDLRQGGRVVGIVSHVADLRQRIPAQLRVVKGRAGSTVIQ